MMQLDLTHALSTIVVTGNDAAQFLQSQLTQDINARVKTQLQWQAYCTRDGLVQSLFGLWEKDQQFFLLLPNALVAVTQDLIKKYGVFAKIQTEILSGQPILLEVEAGARTQWSWDIIDPNASHTVFRWITRFERLPTVLDEMMLRDLFIQHAFPWLNAHAIGKFRPHDLNFPTLNLVSFKKGCYPGQEIIARMQYRGKPKSSLRAYRLNGLHTFQIGETLLQNERAIGTVVDIIYGDTFTDVSCVLQNDQIMEDVSLHFPLDG